MDQPDEDLPGQPFSYWLTRVVRDLRAQRGVTVGQVARLAGVSPSTVSRFERRDYWPSLRVWHRGGDAYAEALDMTRLEIMEHVLYRWQKAEAAAYGHDYGDEVLWPIRD